jgi:hypothetical protein
LGAFSLPYQLLGNTVTIDYNTQTNQRGKFARVKVDIDLEKPTEKIEDLDQKVSYDEGFPQVCYTYGQVGHNSILCPFKIPEKSTSKDDDNVTSDHGCSGKPYPSQAKFQR